MHYVKVLFSILPYNCSCFLLKLCDNVLPKTPCKIQVIWCPVKFVAGLRHRFHFKGHRCLVWYRAGVNSDPELVFLANYNYGIGIVIELIQPERNWNWIGPNLYPQPKPLPPPPPPEGLLRGIAIPHYKCPDLSYNSLFVFWWGEQNITGLFFKKKILMKLPHPYCYVRPCLLLNLLSFTGWASGGNLTGKNIILFCFACAMSVCLM